MRAAKFCFLFAVSVELKFYLPFTSYSSKQGINFGNLSREGCVRNLQ